MTLPVLWTSCWIVGIALEFINFKKIKYWKCFLLLSLLWFLFPHPNFLWGLVFSLICSLKFNFFVNLKIILNQGSELQQIYSLEIFKLKYYLGHLTPVLCVTPLWSKLIKQTSFEHILLFPFKSPASFPSLHSSPSPFLFHYFCLFSWFLLWSTISTSFACSSSFMFVFCLFYFLLIEFILFF